MCSALHREQTAAMNIFEIPERKLVSGFGRFGMGLIDPEMPFAVLSESVRANELVLVLRHRNTCFKACAPHGYPIRGSSYSVEGNSAGRTDWQFVFHDLRE